MIVYVPVSLGTTSFQTFQIYKPQRVQCHQRNNKGVTPQTLEKEASELGRAICWTGLVFVLCSPTILPAPAPRRDSRAKHNGYRNKHVN